MTAHTLLEKWKLLQAILAHPDLTGALRHFLAMGSQFAS
jgi:hypothetical protein